jgi:hypothetical protein
MTRVLICVLGFLTVLEFENLAVAQEPTLVPARSSAFPCDQLTGGPSAGSPTRPASMSYCFPANCCCDDYEPRPFPRSCFPAYAAWYKCVPARDITSCPRDCQQEEKRSWWFIPSCHALREALWLDP